MADHPSEDHWHFFGKSIPKSEIVFGVQVVLIYIVVIACIVNLSLDGDDSKLWTALLASNIGYLLPNPSLKRHR